MLKTQLPYITWDDPNYLSNEFVANLLENATDLYEDIIDKERYIFSGAAFNNVRFGLTIWCKNENNICYFNGGLFYVRFGSFEYLDCFKPGSNWDILEVKWILDQEASKRIWSIYKKYKNA